MMTFASQTNNPFMELYYFQNFHQISKTMSKKSTLLRWAITLIVSTLFAYTSHAQVTSSAISGLVTDSKKGGLPGATVIAVHVPSGTKYGAVTNVDGRFAFPSVRVGGPYKITVSFVGFQTIEQEGYVATLGSTTNADFTLAEEGTTLQEVVVRTNRGDVFSTERTGASTTIGSEQLKSLPTISRSLSDFTRLTPQSNGNSFGGRDNRYNNITIDGANFNNNFGLSGNNLPGGSAQPISLDAIEEVQVNIAPFDVRQANFTGAGINVITKSGTNQLKGTAYTYYRDQSFNGRKVGDLELPELQKTQNNIYGASLGGALIKNKLFFFVNGEFEREVRPGFNFVASRPGLTGPNVANVPATDLERVSSFLSERYGYETGPYENYANNFTQQNFKFVTRLDWNINDNHKFNIRYSQVSNTDDQVVNGTSAPNPRGTSSRVSQNALTFQNSNYGFLNRVNTVAAELNSTWKGKLANQFLATYSFIQDTRTSPSTEFPFVDIMRNGDNYISFGYELFSYKNDVKNTVLNFIDNLTYYAGKHTILAGVSYEHMYFANSFLRYGTSYYRFASVDDFINGATPTAFAYTYPLIEGRDAVAELTFGQASAYIQDEFAVNPKLKLIAGVRMDLPIYYNPPLENPAITALTFLNGEKINTGIWPKSTPAFSPRVGFNYSLKEKGLQVRGGTGIFNGRLPFVWFTNQPTNSGMVQFTYETTTPNILRNFPFNPDPNAYLAQLPRVAGQSAPSSLAAVSPDFRMPQIWRTNFAIDKRIDESTSLTLEAIYSNDLITVYQRNINYNNPNGAFTGPDTRPRWTTTASRRVVSNITEAMVLDNTRGGGGWTLTAEVKRNFSKNLFTSLAYTFNNVKDLTGNPGAQAASAWSGNRAVGSLNDLPLAFSSFAVPHRVVGSFSYRLDYAKNFATTVSLFYQGSSQGRYSYVYNGDMNNDGINGSDLIYIPKDASEITFRNITNSNGTIRHTAQAQSDAFFALVEQDKYLSKNKGQYAERDGALLPWFNRWDFRLLQDFKVNVNGEKNTLQLSVDVLNLPNLINSAWGVRSRLVANNGAFLRFAGVNAQGRPEFQMAEVSNQLITKTFEDLPTVSTTWGAQVGLRYIFN